MITAAHVKYSNCICYKFFIFCPICMKFSHNILHTYSFNLSIIKHNWKIRRFWVVDPLKASWARPNRHLGVRLERVIEPLVASSVKVRVCVALFPYSQKCLSEVAQCISSVLESQIYQDKKTKWQLFPLNQLTIRSRRKIL